MIRSIIVDDEEPARSWLLRLLITHKDIAVVGEARDGLEAVTAIEQSRPDLLFLDIQLPGLTGFEVLHSVTETLPLPLTIFVTGYDQHALAAFEANALAYLLKPVEPERLAHALDRARALHLRSAERENESSHIREVARSSSSALRRIVCRKRDRLVLVPPEQILWFRVEDGIVKASTMADTFWTNHQLNELEANLPSELFFRARREVLVNVDAIKEIRPYFKGGYLLIMSDASGTEIAISERQVRSFRQRIPGL